MPTARKVSPFPSAAQIDGYFKFTIMESVLALASSSVPTFALALIFRSLTLALSTVVTLLLTLLLLIRPHV